MIEVLLKEESNYRSDIKRKRTNNNLQNTPQKTSLVITAFTITSAQNSEVSGITSCV
jgi:hypothetical protein